MLAALPPRQRRNLRSASEWSPRSTSRHWREKRDFLGSRNRRIRPHMGAIDGRADDFGILEGAAIFLAALGQPSHELTHGPHPGRRIDFLLGPPDALADPREIEDLHRHSSIA